MCGIVFASGPDYLENGDHAMAALLPRGRDSCGQDILKDQKIFLGHRRLAILGANGHQPFWNKNKTIACLVNGQFYPNHLNDEIKNYPFTTETDSEWALAIYETMGVSALEELNGEYALVIVDLEKQMVYAQRDPFGVKPLYFKSGENLVIASEPKAFKNLSLSQDALFDALTFQYITPNRTLFDVQQVMPGSRVEFSLKNHTYGSYRYFIPFSPNQKSTSNPVGDFKEAISAAVWDRCQTELPIALHLSGGCDSSLIAALAKQHKNNVHAFCVEFEDVHYNESAIAQKTADILDIPLTILPLSRHEMLMAWGEAFSAAEHLAINGHFSAKFLLNKEVNRQGFRVSLSGEGSDELFLGYPFLQAEFLKDKGIQKDIDPGVSLGIMMPEEFLPAPAIQEALGFVPVWLSAKLGIGRRLQDLCGKKIPTQDVLRSLAEVLKPQSKGLSPVHVASNAWCLMGLGSYILPTLADAPEAFWHIQGRTPFLDSRVASIARRITPEQNGVADEPKKIIRQYLRELGLSHVADRAKHPFEAPPFLACEKSQLFLRERFLNTDWSHTPISHEKIASWISAWPSFSIDQQRSFEPVVGILLSLSFALEKK